MLLETRGLSHTYSAGTPFERTAIEHIDLGIDSGEFLGIIGHTGSGKSTLIQHFNALLKPTAGQVLFEGKDVWSDPAFTRALRFQVGLVFQYPEHQLFEETVYRVIAFGPKNMGLSEEEIRERVYEAAGFVGVPERLLESSPFELSGGQKRRVAIAGVLAMRPQMMILDEPTAGLDPRGRDEILDQVARLNRQHGLTILLVSHSMEDMARNVDRLLVMNHGSLVYDDTPKAVFTHYKELEKMGLAAPEVTYIAEELRERGIDLAPSITTVDEAVEAIFPLLKKKGGKG